MPNSMGYNKGVGTPTNERNRPLMDTTNRCDNCGAQAYVSFVLNDNKGMLLFCGNHWTRNKAALEGKGVGDESALEQMREDELNKMKVPADA
jgi:hypothetical protein